MQLPLAGRLVVSLPGDEPQSAASLPRLPPVDHGLLLTRLFPERTMLTLIPPW
jgi:hypothetical protein